MAGFCPLQDFPHFKNSPQAAEGCKTEKNYVRIGIIYTGVVAVVYVKK